MNDYRIPDPYNYYEVTKKGTDSYYQFDGTFDDIYELERHMDSIKNRGDDWSRSGMERRIIIERDHQTEAEVARGTYESLERALFVFGILEGDRFGPRDN